jgi:hypothetical protein
MGDIAEKERFGAINLGQCFGTFAPRFMLAMKDLARNISGQLVTQRRG